MADHLERDEVIRRYLRGRSWDENPEFQLVRKLVVQGHPALAAFPFVYDYEWEVWPGRADCGKGDLIFTDGVGTFVVVEVKYIDDSRTGKTVRVKRNKSRNAVWQQARTDAGDLKRRVGGEIRAFTYTNQSGLQEVNLGDSAPAALGEFQAGGEDDGDW